MIEHAAGKTMRLGLCTSQTLPWATLVERWSTIERLGFDSAWIFDHFMDAGKEYHWYYEAWTALAGLAMATSRVDLGVLVSGNTYRLPALVAKEAITVDHISGGRLMLGMGAGWHAGEHEAYGFDFPPAGERVRRFEEAIAVIEALQRDGRATVEGRYYHLHDAPCEPKPVRGRIPLVIGTSGDKMLRVAARHADVWNMVGNPDEIRAAGERMLAACAEVGRDPAEIRWSAAAWAGRVGFDPLEDAGKYRDLIERYREIGVTEVLCSWGRDTPASAIERLAGVVASMR